MVEYRRPNSAHKKEQFMHRSMPLVAAFAVVTVVVCLGLARAAVADCATQPCQFLPYLERGGVPQGAPTPILTTPTRSATPGAISTPIGTATPTQTRTPTATATVTRTPTQALPTATPTLPPPSFVSCDTLPNAVTAPDWPVKITNIDKGVGSTGESVTLQNRSSVTVNLSGWIMCSVTGGQHHPISGSLAPGEVKTFINTGGPIWNNNSSDPGALYNNAGQLVSYYGD